MPRERKGSILERKDGSIWARITYVDVSGKRKDVLRRADNRTHARQLIKGLLRELEDRGERSIESSRMTFEYLATRYTEAKIFPAEYHGNRKVAGLRSWRSPKGYVQVLVRHFGKRLLRDITHNDIERFKLERLKSPTAKGERTIAAVNRELETLRAVLRFAIRQGWIARSPFEFGNPLISKADEIRRERVLTHQEENRLLAVCSERRAHLRPILIAAMDTAMRRGELFKLKWSDIDLKERKIHVRATTTKTQRSRTVGITPRLITELQSLWELSPKIEDDLVFGITDTIKTAFASACKAAGIENFRFHDCRHTAITRMVQAGMSATEVMKISGHTQMSTFARYVNPNDDAARRAADLLAAFNAIALQDNREVLIN